MRRAGSLGRTHPGARTRDPPSAVRAVFFDFDDTLFDHTRSLVDGLRALRAVDRRLVARPFREVVRRYEHLLDAIQPGLPGGPSTHAEARAARFRILNAWLGGTGDWETARSWSSTYRAAYQASRRPVPGALPLLRHLHSRVCVGVLTNNHTAEQKDKLAALGIAPWVDFMITSEDEGVQKPDPAIFRAALERAGVLPEAATMIGDNWSSDIVGARAAGLHAVWLQRRGRRPPGYPEVRVLRSFTPLRATWEVLLSDRPEPLRPGSAGYRAERFKNRNGATLSQHHGRSG